MIYTDTDILDTIIHTLHCQNSTLHSQITTENPVSGLHNAFPCF